MQVQKLRVARGRRKAYDGRRPPADEVDLTEDWMEASLDNRTNRLLAVAIAARVVSDYVHGSNERERRLLASLRTSLRTLAD